MGEGILTARPQAATSGEGGFTRRLGILHGEEVSLTSIADAAGTPSYVYSAGAIRAQYGLLTRALSAVPHRLHFSVKANSNLAVLALLRELGAGADIVSGGELFRAMHAGFSGGDIVFAGVGKTEEELGAALDARVGLVNVESESELRLLHRLAVARGTVADVALRVNPEVTVDTPHPYTRTGERGMKFGIPHDEAGAVATLAETLPGIRLAGLAMHIGSQVSGVEPFRLGLERLTELVAALRGAGSGDLRYLDAGGGLAVTYDNEAMADVEAFARVVVPAARETGLELLIEPGRFLVGNAGVLMTRVLYRKRSGGKEYVITDAGMNDLLRPSHYHAYHRIEAVASRGGSEVVDVVGPVCESGDFFALDRTLDVVEPGDLLVVRSAGAYGFVMASNYNSRPRAAEVIVDGSRWAIARSREGHEDLIRHEHVHPQWRSA